MEGIEDAFVSKLLQFNNIRYGIGLFNVTGLFVNEEWIKDIICSNETVEYYEYHIQTKEVRIIKEGKEAVSYSFNSQNYTILDIDNNGMRWEGIVVNGHPFGYGSLYNNDNELIHRGVMIGDNKECFGIDFYSGIGKIEYIGCYWNNERHGFGMLYDRKGGLLYEGDWLFDSIYYDLNETVRLNRNGVEESCIHSLIRGLVIFEGCRNDYDGDLILCGFVNLDSIVIDKNTLNNLNSLEISGNPVLKRIEIANGGYSTGAFNKINDLSISSIIMYYD